MITILSVVEPLFPQHNGSQPFISKITLTLMFSLIPTHLVVETPADSLGPRRQTRGTRLQRSRSLARSLRQLKYVTNDTDNRHR